MNAKKQQKIEKVTKPFVKGDIVDRTTLGSALKFFLGTVVMCIAYLILCVMMNFEAAWLNILINVSIVAGVCLFFYQYGINAGADAVNQGEIMYGREEKGRPVAEWERSMCYHPLKGLVSALIGSIPLVVCSVVLALIAKRQMTNLGVLPSWLGGIEGRQEIGNALAFYHENGSMSLESVLRMVVRMSTMPFVNMIGASDKDAMLVLERISPVLNLLPALAYGLAYMNGVSVRTSVHTSIAQGKKKIKRKQAKERRARMQNRGPQQLN
jgi:hypothetical protein